MPARKQIGNKNDVGHQIVALRKARTLTQQDLLTQMQTRGCDIGQSSLSDLEGQKRAATDRELRVLAEIFGVPMEELFNPDEKE